MTFKGPFSPKPFCDSIALQRVALLKRQSLKGDPNPPAPHHLMNEGRRISPEKHRKQCTKEVSVSQGISKLKRFVKEEKEKHHLLGFAVIGRSRGGVNPRSSYEKSSREI